MSDPVVPDDPPLASLVRLMQLLRQRAIDLPTGSYTTALIRGGVDKIGGKIREESEELIEAAKSRDEAAESNDASDQTIASRRQHTVYEAGDLLYHTMVLLAQQGIDLSEVAAELARREGIGGLAEKASRATHQTS